MELKSIITFIEQFKNEGITELKLAHGDFVFELKQVSKPIQKPVAHSTFEIKTEPPVESKVDSQTGFTEAELFHSSI